MTENYYTENMHAHKLYRAYQTGSKRIKQYLKAEISFVAKHLHGTEHILELGAGYGRIMKELSKNCHSVTGIDISKDNVEFGNKYLGGAPNAKLLVMDAHDLHFEETFDIVLCLQNGLSAMKAQPFEYIHKMMALASPGGKAFISSYSAKFWGCRLAWFQEQAGLGLLGEIDAAKTGDGVIVCKDGFQATTHSWEDLDAAGKASGFQYEVVEVDESSVFLIVAK